MSLLMDALRKAELQKQKLGNAGLAEQEPGLTLEPLGATPDSPLSEAQPRQETPAPEETARVSRMAGSGLPELPSRLEDLDEQFLAHAPKPPIRPQAAIEPLPPLAPPPTAEPVSARREPPAAPPAAPESAEAIRNLFEAKHPPARNKRRLAIVTGVLGFVAALGIGGYFWWELQPKNTLLAGHANVPASTTPAAPAASLAPAAAPMPAQGSVSPASTFQVPPPPLAIGKSAGGSEDADDEEAPPPSVRPTPKPAPSVEPVAPSPSPVRLTRAQVKVDTTLEQAYQAFNRNEFDLARNLWQKTLAGDPLNTDALHGMAALALRQKQTDDAAGYFRRVLDANPKDAIALSALSSLRSPVDPSQAESQLKMQLVDQPDSPHLNFALGNLYARYERWPDAQQAYFKAHIADPANPDYLFNLAISLDRLRQPHLAIQYYTRALAAAEQQPASFEPAQVAARLKILQ